MKHYYLQYKQFRFVDSTLLGEVMSGFFSRAVDVFFGQIWLTHRKLALTLS